MLPEDDIRGTPPELFGPLNAEFRFSVDVCANRLNALLPRYFGAGGESEDGLAACWAGERAWCNPPFSQIPAWVAKSWRAMSEGAAGVVMLVPATRTEQPWWQRLVEPCRDGQGVLVPGVALKTRFLAKRPRFLKDGVPMGSPKFGCVLLIWGRS